MAKDNNFWKGDIHTGGWADPNEKAPDALADITKKLMGSGVLKTCPFCGGQPEVATSPLGYAALRCGSCGIQTEIVEIQDGQEEVAFKGLMVIWNKRVGG